MDSQMFEEDNKTPAEKLTFAQNTVYTSLKQISDRGFSQMLVATSSAALKNASTLLPKSDDYRPAKALIKRYTQSLSDLSYAATSSALTPAEIAREAKKIRINLRTEMSEIISALPASVEAGVSVEGDDVAVDENHVLGSTPADQKLVQLYFQKTQQLPKQYKTNGGIAIVRVPIVVIGIFGTTVERLKSLAVPVKEFIEGYHVLDNQYVVGFDTKVIETKHGIKAKQTAKYAKLVQEVLTLFNEKNPTSLALASEDPHQHGGMIYYWVMPERQLSGAMVRAGHMGESWGFPSKLAFTKFQNTDRKLTRAEIVEVKRLSKGGMKERDAQKTIHTYDVGNAADAKRMTNKLMRTGLDADDIASLFKLNEVSGPLNIKRVLDGEKQIDVGKPGKGKQRTLKDTELAELFKYAMRGMTPDEIAEKMFGDDDAYKFTGRMLVARILRGEELTAETFDLRARLREAQRRDFSKFLKQKKAAEIAHEEVAERDARIAKANAKRAHVPVNRGQATASENDRVTSLLGEALRDLDSLPR